MPRPSVLGVLRCCYYCCLCAALVLMTSPTPRSLVNASSAENESRYGQICSFLETDNKCGPNERCVAETTDTDTRCSCLQGYQYSGRECTKVPLTEAPSISTTTVKPDPESSSSGGSPIAAILLIPICLAVLGGLVYVGARRYKWIQRFRQFRQNRYGSVLVTRDEDDDYDRPGHGPSPLA